MMNVLVAKFENIFEIHIYGYNPALHVEARYNVKKDHMVGLVGSYLDIAWSNTSCCN